MADILNLKDSLNKWRQSIAQLGKKSQTEPIQVLDEEGQPVAVVLSYAAFRKIEREADFAVLDRIWEKANGIDPQEAQAVIDQAVAEAKAQG